MRSILRHVTLPLGAFVFMFASSAHADGPSVVMRGTTPWIHFGGKYEGPRDADASTRGRAIVRAQSKFSASLVTSGVDRFGDGDTVVRYEQSHLGLPVIGRGAAVRLSGSGEPITTVVDLEENLPSTAVPTVTPADAASVASGRFAVGASPSDAHLVVWPTLDREARLAYAVLPRVPASLATAPRAIIDAQTGEVLEVRDMVVFAKANMYPFNPAKTPATMSEDLSLKPTGTTLTNPFLESSNCIDKKTVKAVNMFGFDLTVHVCDLVQVATANSNGDFNYEPQDKPGSPEARKDPFSEVSIYYHASKAYSFFRTLQQDEEAQVVVDKPLRLVANLQMPPGITSGNIEAAANPDTPLDPFQNAFFSPKDGGLGAVFQQLYGFESGALWFGQGPKRDYAYDGDVVYHEFGHAVVDATLKLGAWHVDAHGAIDAPGAMNEGLADYFSSAITGDPDVGEYAALDLGGGDKVIRTLANKDRCSGVIGEVHADSTLFSGALWQARQSLGEADRSKFDAGLYKAMRTNPGRGDLGFEDLANMFIATLKVELPVGATALEAAMKDRGVLPTCDRILTFESAPITSADKRIGFIAPGRQSVSVKGVAPGIIQVRASLPPNTASVAVSFNARSGGGQGPIGGNAKPFAPLVLAKFGAPITWDPKSGHNADAKAAAAAASGSTTATIAIPEGTTADTIYVQIASTGDSDGAYDRVSLAFSSREATEPGSDEAPPSEAGSKPPAATTTTVEGCAMIGNSTNKTKSALFPGILAAAAALTAIRRRRGTS